MNNTLKAVQISNNIYWVGAVDWSMRNNSRRKDNLD